MSVDYNTTFFLLLLNKNVQNLHDVVNLHRKRMVVCCFLTSGEVEIVTISRMGMYLFMKLTGVFLTLSSLVNMSTMFGEFGNFMS